MYVYPETMLEKDFFQLHKRLLKTTRKCQLQYQYQNIVLGSVSYDQNIMI